MYAVSVLAPALSYRAISAPLDASTIRMRSSSTPALRNVSCASATLLARFTAAKKKQLLKNEGIVRNRLKIDSAVTNAQAFLAVQKEFGSFDRYIWQFVGGKPVKNSRKGGDIPARTPQSDALSKDLQKRGFRFVGSTICYAFMQATGMVNDHLVSCYRHRELKNS